MVPDESEFGRRVPLVVGACTIGQIIDIIQESKIDHLSMPWATVRMVQLLSCQKSTAVLALRSAETQSEGASRGPQEADMDELVTVRESACLGPFQTKIIEGQVKPLLGDTAHIMITLLKAGEGQLWDSSPLPLGSMSSTRTHALKTAAAKFHSWSGIWLTVTSSLRREYRWCELSPEMEAILGAEARHEPMSVVARQEKLLEKLNLDGLAHWSPTSAVVARELVLAYHDVFTLESNELGCTSAIEHEIHIENSKPFKGWFQCIPPPLLEEVRTLLRDMLEMGVIRPSQSPWCNVAVLVQKKDGTLHFCVDFRCLNAQTKKDSYPLPRIH